MKRTPEQIEFCDLIRRFFQEKVTSEYLRGRIAVGARPDQSFDQDLQSLGIYEGFAGQEPIFSSQELNIIAEEVGYFLVPEPIIERIISQRAIDCPGSSPEDHVRIQAIAPAESKGTIAYPECCHTLLDEDGKHASGKISWARGVEGSSWLLGFLGVEGNRKLFACSLQDASVTIQAAESLDLTANLHRIELRSTPIVVFGSEPSLLHQDTLEASKAAEVAGICRRVIAMTVEYAKTRQQFGSPIGSFQAIQQKLADCYARSEALLSLSQFAAWSAVNSPRQRHLTSRAAILDAAHVGPAVCEAAIQAHGGIGFTWEYDLHLFLRRAKAIQAAFGLSDDRARALIDAVRAT